MDIPGFLIKHVNDVILINSCVTLIIAEEPTFRNNKN